MDGCSVYDICFRRDDGSERGSFRVVMRRVVVRVRLIPGLTGASFTFSSLLQPTLVRLVMCKNSQSNPSFFPVTAAPDLSLSSAHQHVAKSHLHLPLLVGFLGLCLQAPEAIIFAYSHSRTFIDSSFVLFVCLSSKWPVSLFQNRRHLQQETYRE
jgi:hypothetical protein